MKKILKNDKVERAIITFFEAFFTFISINALTTDFGSKTAIYGLLAGALGSALSVAINTLKERVML